MREILDSLQSWNEESGFHLIFYRTHNMSRVLRSECQVLSNLVLTNMGVYAQILLYMLVVIYESELLIA